MTERVYAILSMLIVQFFLGMGENVLGTPASDASTLHNAVAGIVLGLHALTAIGIIIAAVQINRLRPNASPWVQKWTVRGAASVGLAFVSGLLTLATSWSEFFSFLMASGFILAFTSYGLVLLSLSSKQRPSKPAK
ncbi:MAG TPA: hypothetical protein VLG27_04680 [Candidatus Saccharimonadia bacterium]|nr:hypothetical protein [Candidatus Saccharimonadia bacterium]